MISMSEMTETCAKTSVCVAENRESGKKRRKKTKSLVVVSCPKKGPQHHVTFHLSFFLTRDRSTTSLFTWVFSWQGTAAPRHFLLEFFSWQRTAAPRHFLLEVVVFSDKGLQHHVTFLLDFCPDKGLQDHVITGVLSYCSCSHYWSFVLLLLQSLLEFCPDKELLHHVITGVLQHHVITRIFCPDKGLQHHVIIGVLSWQGTAAARH